MGFWERLFSNSPINNASGNNVAFSGVRNSKEAVDEPNFSTDYTRTDAFDYSEDHNHTDDHDHLEKGDYSDNLDNPEDHDYSDNRDNPEDRDYSEDYEYTEVHTFSNAHAVFDERDLTTEYASELYQDPDVKTASSYSINGVFFREAENIYRLIYDGILAKDGARDVYAVVGTDENGAWRDIRYYPMQKTDGSTFEVLFPVPVRERINVAFKDGADNWDNNSGRNYTYVKEGG